MRLRRLSDGVGDALVYAATDPLFPSVPLLLHMSGGNGSTVFTDSSQSSKVVTPHGGAKISNAQSKFLWSSATFPSSGYLTVPHSADLNFGTGDFCVEFWGFLNSNTGSQSFAAKICNANEIEGWFLEHSSSEAFAYIGGIYLAGSANPTSEWFHMALTRASGVVSLYRNGSRLATGTPTIGTDSSCDLSIGSRPDNSSSLTWRVLDGYINEFRVTKGYSRYSGTTYTVPKSPFPDA